MNGLQYQGGTTRQVRSDLFVLRPDQREVYFEMKTVKPNKNTFRDMKRDMLTIMAMCHQQNAQAYAAMSYNPAGEGNVYTPDFSCPQDRSLLVRGPQTSPLARRGGLGRNDKSVVGCQETHTSKRRLCGAPVGDSSS